MPKLKQEIKDLRSLSVGSLSAKIKESQRQLLNLKQDQLLGRLKDYRQIRTLRQTIARASTILDEKIAESLNTEGK